MNTEKTPKPKTLKATIRWKNPDMPKGFSKWGEFGEYYDAEIEVNQRTGKGTIKILKRQ